MQTCLPLFVVYLPMETNVASSKKQEKSSQGSVPRSSRKQDLTWNYVSEAVDSKGKKVTACNFCGKQYVGIGSMKQHLAGLNQSKTACKEVSSEVRDSIIKSMKENKEKTMDKIVVDLDEMNDYEVKDGQSSQQTCTSQSRKRKVSIHLIRYVPSKRINTIQSCTTFV